MYMHVVALVLYWANLHTKLIKRTVAQGSTCLEVGVYMFNYAGCHACQTKSFIDAADKSREEEEGGSEENITYKRTNY